jgi:hypothetical protein
VPKIVTALIAQRLVQKLCFEITMSDPRIDEAKTIANALQGDPLTRIGRSLDTLITLLQPVLAQQRELVAAEQLRLETRTQLKQALIALLSSKFIQPALALALLSLAAAALNSLGLPVIEIFAAFISAMGGPN